MGKACGELDFPQGSRAHKPWRSWKKLGDSPPTIHMWITRVRTGKLLTKVLII